MMIYILAEVEIRDGGEILSEGFKLMQISTNRLNPAISRFGITLYFEQLKDIKFVGLDPNDKI